MHGRLRAAGWGLLALAVVLLAVIVPVGALRAHGDAEFNRWVGWATVAALPVAALGVVLLLWDKMVGRTAAPEIGISETEDELAAIVLAQAQVARSRLIGADEASDLSANVRFVRVSGPFRAVGGPSEGDLDSVLTYYQSLSPGRLVVLGDPGAGKTVLALELLIRLLEVHQQHRNRPVPVLVSAAAYDTGLAWEDWLAGHLALRFSIDAGVAARLVRDGRILPIVDGLDEMDLAGDPQRAHVLVTALNAWMRGRERAPVVVTCRRADYQALRREIDRATHVEMIPLTGNEAADYLQDQFLNTDERQRWQRVLANLHAHPAGLLASQLATPWRLTLALAAFRSDGDPAGLIPETSTVANPVPDNYSQRIDSLLLSRYISSAIRLHDPAGRYDPQQVQRWLTALADGLAWQARHNKSATDIRLDQWWQPVGRWATRLTHTALAAVPFLAWLIGGAVIGGPLLASASVGFLVVAIPAIDSSPSPSRLKVRGMTTGRGLLRSAAGLAAGLTVGLVVGFAVGLVFGPAAAISGGITAGLAGGLAGGLLLGISDDSPQTLGPRDVIRADGQYGLVFGLVVGLAFGFAFGLAAGLRYGLAAGLGLGLGLLLGGALAGGLAGGATVWTRYHVSIVIIAVRQQGPLRFGTFLDWAHQAGLLRVSGVAYQFRQLQLRDWLKSPR